MIITIDTGGTKTLISVFENGETTAKEIVKFPTPHGMSDYKKILISNLEQNLDVKKAKIISLATPGIIKNKTIVNGGGNLVDWKNFELAKELEEYFSVKTCIENDAKLGGLGEVRFQNLSHKRCLYLTISTGIGAGLVVNGKITPSMKSTEAGLILLEKEGKYQIWERFASGKAYLKKYGMLAQDIEDPKIWNEWTDDMVRGLCAILPILQPEIVIIGGGVGNFYEKFGAQLEEKINKLIPEVFQTEFTKAKNPNEAVIYGCYYNALAELNSK